MKKLLIGLGMLLSCYAHAQKTNSIALGQTTVEELKMNSYDLDSSAVATVLYEQSNFYVSHPNTPRFTVDNYHRIKILTTEGLDKGTFSFGLYRKDKLLEATGVTYNLGENDSIVKFPLNPEDLIRNEVNEDFEEIIINLPQVKVGSVVEFQYSVSTTNPNIDDWYFQTDIPKLRSVFQATVPTYIEHLVMLKGRLKLSNSEFEVKKKCYPQNKWKKNLCNYSKYILDSVPKFEEEPLMPDPSSYISRIEFTLSKFTKKGYVPYYAKRFWYQFDSSYEKYLLSDEKRKKSFYQKIVPDSVKTGKSKLEIAKKLYYFVQNHYTWNKYKGGDTRFKFRKRSQKKSGSVDLITASLYNSLKASGIEVYYVLVGTRGYGIPDKNLPDFSSFNYTLLKVVIDEKVYYLDAANKKLRFGDLSPMTMNGEARVMSVGRVGAWEKLVPKHVSSKSSVLNLSFDDEMNLEGNILIRKDGVDAFAAREFYSELGKKQYLEMIETDIDKVAIDSIVMKNDTDLEKPLFEEYSIYLDSEDLNTEIDSDDTIVFSPVFFDQLTENPFKSSERTFELDFIYNRKNVYRLKIEIPENYKVTKLPQDIGLQLPNKGGTYVYKASQNENSISIYIRFNITKTLFSVEEYYYLKTLYEKIIQAEDAVIELQKIEE
jgi:hypothetical protein